VFGEKGPGAPLEDVAAAAGVTKSLVFRYWETKDALLDEVLLRADERYRGWVEHAVWASESDPIPALTSAAVGFFAQPVHALFDPLITRPSTVARVPELVALDRLIGDIVDRIAAAPQREPARAVLDAVVLGTLRGWIGAPDIVQQRVSPTVLRDTLTTVVRSGLHALGPLPATGRRPRRAPTRLSARIAARSTLEADLFDAALEVFATNGYELTRLEDIATAAGTTASACFTYWPSKRDLFFQLRSVIVGDIAERLLAAIARESSTTARLRAAIRANLTVHYEHPEYQPVLLPVPAFPPESELETVGWRLLMEQLELVPEFDDAGELLAVAATIGLAVLRGVTFAMHRNAVHPDIAIGIAEDYLVAGLAGLARHAGVDFDA